MSVCVYDCIKNNKYSGLGNYLSTARNEIMQFNDHLSCHRL